MAMMLATILPGMGQCYGGRVKRGVAFFFTPFLFHFLMILYFLLPQTRWSAIFNAFPLALLCFVLFGAIDAYVCAKNYNHVYKLQRKVTLSRKIFFITAILSFVLLINPPILIVKGIDFYVKTNIAGSFKVPTDAMEPTLRMGEGILVAKNIYKNADPKRGDVVAFKLPTDLNTLHVKRIVGLPDDSLEIKDGGLFVNGKKIDQFPFSNFYYQNVEGSQYGKLGQLIKVPKDSFFALGDYSAHSYDSRHYGFVDKKNLIGKAYKVYLPFERSRPIK